MKGKKIYILIIFLVGIGCIAYALMRLSNGSGPANHQFATTTPQTIVETYTVTSKTISDNDPSGAYQITASYPVINGLSNPLVQQKINAALYKTAQQDIADFKTNQAGNIDQSTAINRDQSTLSITFSTTTQPVEGLLTFTFDQNFYSAGAAHPGDQIDSYTFDVSSGNLVNLSGLFIGNYLDILSQYSRQALAQSLGAGGNPDQINEGTLPTTDNFAVFVPQADGLHIIFNQYQVASFAADSQEIVISYAVLKSVINPTSPLKPFAQ